jgi:hypothetical protein
MKVKKAGGLKTISSDMLEIYDDDGTLLCAIIERDGSYEYTYMVVVDPEDTGDVVVKGYEPVVRIQPKRIVGRRLVEPLGVLGDHTLYERRTEQTNREAKGE